MANRLLADPCVTAADLVRDLADWLAHCHTDEVVLELQLIEVIFQSGEHTATQMMSSSSCRLLK